MSVRPASLYDIHAIGAKMRVADMEEIWAASQLTPVEALYLGVQHSNPCYTVTYNNEPIAMFGVTPPEGEDFPRVGTVWMLATDRLYVMKSTFLRWSRRWLEAIEKDYDGLMNYVDERNVVSIEWLKWMGFTLIKRHEKYGIHGENFWEFVKVCN